jgi:hypothetical protein
MENHTSNKADETARPPIAKLRIGLINANIWQRVTGEDAFYSVSFERRYKDSQDKWHSTHSFNPDDLLVIAKLADKAHTEITNLRADVID